MRKLKDSTIIQIFDIIMATMSKGLTIGLVILIIGLLAAIIILAVLLSRAAKCKTETPEEFKKKYGSSCWLPEREEYGICGITAKDIENLFFLTNNTGLTCASPDKKCISPAHEYVGIKPVIPKPYIITH